MHVINCSRDLEGSGAGFWVQMVSRVSLQGLHGGEGGLNISGVQISHDSTHTLLS